MATFRVGTYVFWIVVLEVRFSYISGRIPPLAHTAGHTLWKGSRRPAWRLAHRCAGIITELPWDLGQSPVGGIGAGRNGVFTGLW